MPQEHLPVPELHACGPKPMRIRVLKVVHPDVSEPTRPGKTPAASPGRLLVPTGQGMTTDWDFCKNTQTTELFPGANSAQITG